MRVVCHEHDKVRSEFERQTKGNLFSLVAHFLRNWSVDRVILPLDISSRKRLASKRTSSEIETALSFERCFWDANTYIAATGKQASVHFFSQKACFGESIKWNWNSLVFWALFLGCEHLHRWVERRFAMLWFMKATGLNNCKRSRAKCCKGMKWGWGSTMCQTRTVRPRLWCEERLLCSDFVSWASGLSFALHAAFIQFPLMQTEHK